MHVSMLSIKTSLLPVAPLAISPAVASATMATCNKVIHACHADGRILWKSTRQKVTNKIMAMNSGKIASKIGSKKRAALSNAGM